MLDDPPIESVYLIEAAIAGLLAFEGLVLVNALLYGWQAVRFSRKLKRAACSIEEFLGGPASVKRNTHGDVIIERGNKKFRFDIKNPRLRGKSHFQFERRTNKWKVA